MKIMFLSIMLGTTMQFETLGTGETFTITNGVNYVSVICANCDIVMGGDTMNLINQGFTFNDYIGKEYDEIKVLSNAAGTKIAYKYENY
tara:strand:- start:163 stop:429 length:267 start_codon:yes stop_codon:yes gene_type:complete